MAQVFICYRRDDSINTVGRIYSWLKIRLPDDEIFFDLNTITPGVDFPSAISDALASSVKVVLVVIGKKWVESPGENGGTRRRLEEEDDHVRSEIETAFQYQRLVIPVLVEGAKVPRREDLPESLARLAYINAIEVRPDPDFDNDMRRLRDAILAQVPITNMAFHAPTITSSWVPPQSPTGSVSADEATTKPTIAASGHSLLGRTGLGAVIRRLLGK